MPERIILLLDEDYEFEPEEQADIIEEIRQILVPWGVVVVEGKFDNGE